MSEALLRGRGAGGATCPCTAMLPPAVGGDAGAFTSGGAGEPTLAECSDGTVLLAFVAAGQGGAVRVDSP